MKNTKIEWCDDTWNPVTGCLHNCEYCYAKSIAGRFRGVTIGQRPPAKYVSTYELHDLSEPLSKSTKGGKITQSAYPFGFEPTLHRYNLDVEEAVGKKPKTVFVGSMCDLFGDWVPDEWIQAVFDACAKVPQHRYLFLTKNPHRYIKLIDTGKLPTEHWYGETITQGELRGLPKPYKHFISIEPIMGEIVISPLTYVDWVIIGAESGNRRGKVIPTADVIGDTLFNLNAHCWYDNNPHVYVFMKDSLLPIMGEANMRREFPWGGVKW
jgi:protein gp37